jgi:hypothetical protein
VARGTRRPSHGLRRSAALGLPCARPPRLDRHRPTLGLRHQEGGYHRGRDGGMTGMSLPSGTTSVVSSSSHLRTSAASDPEQTIAPFAPRRRHASPLP